MTKIHQPYRIRCSVQMDRMGGLTIHIAGCDVQRELRKRSERPEIIDEGYFIQSDSSINEFKENLTKKQQRSYRESVERGWTTQFLLPEDEVCAMFCVPL